MTIQENQDKSRQDELNQVEISQALLGYISIVG